jgi:hypothetical protein
MVNAPLFAPVSHADPLGDVARPDTFHGHHRCRRVVTLTGGAVLNLFGLP